MEQYIKGESQKRITKVDVEKKIATISHVTQFANEDDRWYMDTVIDLSEESDEDILANAAMNYLIQVIRPKYLKANKPSEIDEKKVHKPKDYPSGRGTGVVMTESRALINTLVYVIGLEKEKAEALVKKDIDAVKKLIAKKLA